MIFPPQKIVRQVVSAIKRGLNGEKIVLTGVFCPDYEYRSKDGSPGQYEYTFKSVGTGVGLVAQQFVRILPFLIEFFQRYDIEYEVMLNIADFEADSEEILNSVSLSREEFIGRCKQSLDAFKETLPDIPMSLFLFKDLAGGTWKKHFESVQRKMLSGDYGDIKKNTGINPVEVISLVARKNIDFYRRWFDRENLDEIEVMRIITEQGVSYAMTGLVFQERFKDQPVIVLSGDRPEMQFFNYMHSDYPTLCCKRVY